MMNSVKATSEEQMESTSQGGDLYRGGTFQPTKIKLMPITSLSTCPHFKFFANQHSDKSLGENITKFFIRSKMPIVEVF